MGPVAVAFSPGHISGYFLRISGPDPQSTGSIGAGLVITEGVEAIATHAPAPAVSIHLLDRDGRVREQREGSPPLTYVMERLGVTAQVVTRTRLPIGAGFGCSAAALLATITALSALHHLNLSRDAIAMLAHEAEVIHRTGLGDVAAVQGGGLACRKGPGIHAEITRRDVREPLFALSFGPLPTPQVLDSVTAMSHVARAFPDRCPEDPEEFFSLSRSFAETSGLLSPSVQRVLAACKQGGIPATMTMLGDGVVALGREAEPLLARFGTPFPLEVSSTGFSDAEVR
jgi:pantoate kinase